MFKEGLSANSEYVLGSHLGGIRVPAVTGIQVLLPRWAYLSCNVIMFKEMNIGIGVS